MTRSLFSVVCIALILGGFVAAEDPVLRPSPSASTSDSSILRAGDRLAILGGTFVERMQVSGEIEAALQCRRPTWKLSVRNLGWSGDDVHGFARKRFDAPKDGFQRLLRDVETANPSVVLIAYGFSEASNGADAVDRFEPGLRRLVTELEKHDRRILLMAPFALPGYRTAGYATWMERCREMVLRVGIECDLPVLTIDWRPTADDLTSDELLPSDTGYAALGRVLADRLVGASTDDRRVPSDDLKKRVIEKNRWFFHRYRPQNETYLFLFRKHEQGNNASEIPRFDALTAEWDARIWAAAADQR